MNKWTILVYLFMVFIVELVDSGSNKESGKFRENGI